MKIKNQPVKGTYEFICEYCGTVFEADESEFKVRTTDILVSRRSFGFLKSKTMGTYQPSRILLAECPVCKDGYNAETKIAYGESYEEEIVYFDF